MSTEDLSSEVVLVVLPAEPELRDELEVVNEKIANGDDRDLIIDFSRVEILASSSISSLMILHSLMSERGRRLILCNVGLPTKGIFNVVGLREFFDFADDKFDALAKLGVPSETSKT